MKKRKERILLCLCHLSGNEQKFVQGAMGGSEDDRMNLFLEHLGIPERGSVNEGNCRTFSLQEIDFTYTDSVIATLRAQSESFLGQALR